MRAAWLALLGMAVGAVVLGQKPLGPVTEDKHFRWSERQAHELDYKHTIANDKALEPAVRKALFKFIYAEFRRLEDAGDHMYADMSMRELWKLARDTRIDLVDLNGDGKPEILAQGNGLGACGATGNCDFWVFEQTPSEVRCLLDTHPHEGAFEKVVVRPWSTNRYRDIVLGGHVSASERDIVWYKFVDGEYRRASCYFLSWIGDHGEQLQQSPDISSVSCDKEYRQGK